MDQVFCTCDLYYTNLAVVVVAAPRVSPAAVVAAVVLVPPNLKPLAAEGVAIPAVKEQRYLDTNAVKAFHCIALCVSFY